MKVDSRTIYKGFRLKKNNSHKVSGSFAEWDILDPEKNTIGFMYRLGTNSDIEHLAYVYCGSLDCFTNGTTMRWTFPPFVDRYIEHLEDCEKCKNINK